MHRRSSRSWSLMAWRERPIYRRALEGQWMCATRTRSSWLWSVRRMDEDGAHAQGCALTRRRAFLAAEAAALRAPVPARRAPHLGQEDGRYEEATLPL